MTTAFPSTKSDVGDLFHRLLPSNNMLGSRTNSRPRAHEFLASVPTEGLYNTKQLTQTPSDPGPLNTSKSSDTTTTITSSPSKMAQERYDTIPKISAFQGRYNSRKNPLQKTTT